MAVDAPVRLAFLDTETTGTEPGRHHVFEIACMVVEGCVEEVLSIWMPVDLSTADPGALRINRYYERKPKDMTPRALAAHMVAKATSNAILVGAVPSFDAAFLDAFLRQEGLVPAWHYHLCDVEALAAGKLGVPPPWKSHDLSRALGVEPNDFERHTALGDVRWCRAMFEAAMRS